MQCANKMMLTYKIQTHILWTYPNTDHSRQEGRTNQNLVFLS